MTTRIVDAHVHLFTDAVPSDLEAEMARSGVTDAVVMGTPRFDQEDPAADNHAFLPRLTGRPALVPVYMLDLLRIEASLPDLERRIDEGAIGALKIFCGYQPVSPADPALDPVAERLSRANLPLLIHSGDTATAWGELEYARPIHVDRLAVRHPDLKIVICHLGTPWTLETAEVIYKNENVATDLAGTLIESDSRYGKGYRRDLIRRIEEMVHFVGTVEGKFLFGSDWPLTPMKLYIDLVKDLDLDPEDFDRIFYRNALTFFPTLTPAGRDDRDAPRKVTP